MPGIEYKIETSADLKAVRAVADSLRQQIVAARAAGQEYGGLERQLSSVVRSMSGLSAGTRIRLEMADVIQGVPVIGNFARALNGLGGPITVAVGGLAAMANAASRAIAEFAGSQAKMAKLDAVLAQNGQLTDAYRARLQALAGEFQRTTAIADDRWLDVLSRLTQFGADPSSIERYAEAVKNLAGITGGDVSEAASMFSKALAGQFEMFARLGIRIEKTGTHTERLDDLMRQLAEKGAGVLEAQSRTLAGQWQNLSNAAGDLLEGIGNLIARTGVLQAVISLLTGGLTLLQRLFPSIIPRLEGMENRFRSASERAEELRAKLRETGEESRSVHEAFGEAGRSLDTLNASLAESAAKADAARRAMLELAEATARAAKAKVARDLAEGRIGQEEAAKANAAIENRLQDQKIDAARQAEQEKLDAAKARIAETAEKERAAEAAAAEAAAKAGALRRSLAGFGSRRHQEIRLSAKAGPRRGPNRTGNREDTAKKEIAAGLEDFSRAEADLEKRIAAARSRVIAQTRRRGPGESAADARRVAAAKEELASLQAVLQALRDLPAAEAAAERAEADRIRAQELSSKTAREQAPIIEAAEASLSGLSLAGSAAADERAAAAAEAADAERQRAAESAHKKRMIALQIEANEARQRGDEAAADRAENLARWLAEYKRVWDETGDDTLARRAADSTLPAQKGPGDAMVSQTADRLAQIGGFVGGASPVGERAAEATARNTERTARAAERLLAAATRPAENAAYF